MKALRAVGLPEDNWLEPVVRTTLLVVLTVLMFILFFVLLKRMWRVARTRKRDIKGDRLRPLLLRIMSSDDSDTDNIDRLVGLPDSDWRVVEPTLFAMLGKVTGGSRDQLVDTIIRRGGLARACRGAKSISSVTRARACELLGSLRRSEDVPLLADLLNDRSPVVRRVAVRSLGSIGSAAAVSPLLDAARSGKMPPRDITSALVVLEPSATPLILDAAATSSEEVVRSITAEVIGLRGSIEGATLLAQMLGADPSLEVRIRAARSLGRLGARAGLAPLRNALRSRSPELCAVAARSLGSVGAVASVDDLAQAMNDHPHRVAGNAAEALTRLGRPGLDRLSQLAREGTGSTAAHAREALAVYDLRSGRTGADMPVGGG